jgi:hypothetical protein
MHCCVFTNHLDRAPDLIFHNIAFMCKVHTTKKEIRVGTVGTVGTNSSTFLSMEKRYNFNLFESMNNNVLSGSYKNISVDPDLDPDL